MKMPTNERHIYRRVPRSDTTPSVDTFTAGVRFGVLILIAALTDLTVAQVCRLTFNPCMQDSDCATMSECRPNSGIPGGGTCLADSDCASGRCVPNLCVSQEAFCIMSCSPPCSNGSGWSVSVENWGGPDFVDLACPPVLPTAGSTETEMTAGIVDCINDIADSVGQPALDAEQFLFVAPFCFLLYTPYTLNPPPGGADVCVGLAGDPPGCCPIFGGPGVPYSTLCSFNPDLVRARLSATDCNENGVDDGVEVAYFRESVDENMDGTLDACGDIPTVSDWGFVIMSLLVVALGTLLFKRFLRFDQGRPGA